VPATLHGASYTPIRDLVGVVVNVGDGVQDMKTGDEALGWSQEWTAHAECVTGVTPTRAASGASSM
jgi:NADPH:quinone reductase